MKKTTWIISIVVIVILGYFMIGNNKKSLSVASGEPIKIGHIAALTGVGATVGDEEYKGASLAVKEINAQGGILGRPIELISEDLSLDKMKNAGSVAHKLINVDKVVGIIGPQWDEPASAILPIVEAAKIPMVGPDTTDTIETNGLGQYLFSTWYDNRIGIEVLLKFAQNKGWKTMAIIRPVDAGFWKFTSDLMKEGAAVQGIKVIDDVNINNPLATDFRTFITKVKSEKPEVIFMVTADPMQCMFFKQLKEQGFNVPILATESSGNKASLDQCAGDMENLYFSTPTHFAGYEKFQSDFMKEYSREPLFPSAVTSYDAVRVMVAALVKTNGVGGEVLRQALASTKDFPGASLPLITFKANGFMVTPSDAFEMQTVRGGRFVSVQ